MYDEISIRPARDEMHTKAPSSIICHDRSVQLDFVRAKIINPGCDIFIARAKSALT